MEAGRIVSDVRVGIAPTSGVRWLLGLLRYVAYGLLLVASLMFYVWSRVDVRASAATLDRATMKLATAEAEHERLVLELATRRDLARVGQAGVAMGLVSGVKLVDVPPVGGTR